SKAAHARWAGQGVLIAEAPGKITLAGKELSCAVLSDGRRVISERSLSEALGHTRHPDDYAMKRAAVESGELALPAYVGPPRISQFLTTAAKKKLSEPIRYQMAKG